MTIPEDVKIYAIEGDIIKKLDKQFEGYDVYHIYNDNGDSGYPRVVLKKGNECFPIDMSEPKYESIWKAL